MKKISIFSFLSALLLTALTGCLKDKDYDEHKYGMYSNDSRSVGFIRAAASPLVVGITGQARPVTVSGPTITINGTNQPAASDITINIVEDATLVTAAGLTPLPQGTYSINTLVPTIAAGDSFTRQLQITVEESDQLNPNISYGIGYRIETATAGYTVTRNMSEVVVGFAIKNKYDGVYTLQGYHNRAPYDFPYNTEIELRTVAPNAVAFFWPEQDDYVHPIGVGPNNLLDSYGPDIAPVIVFDLHDDMVTDVYNSSTTVVITKFTGAGSRPGRFDPATRSITVDFNYSNNPLRAYFDDLTFLRERD